MPVDVNLMHGPNTVQGDSTDIFPALSWKAEIKLVVEMIV